MRCHKLHGPTSVCGRFIKKRISFNALKAPGAIVKQFGKKLIPALSGLCMSDAWKKIGP